MLRSRTTIMLNLRKDERLSDLTIRKVTMRQILIEIEDEAYEKFMGMVELCPQARVVDIDEAVVMDGATMAVRIREAILQLRAEHLLRRKFDYAWLKVAMDTTPDMPSFDSAQSYLDYLSAELQLDDLPCESSISKMMDTARGRLFDWTFSDTSDAKETSRRNNIVKRFFNLMRGRK